MISSVVSPFATRPTTVATGIRVPATQGTPPMIWWSTVIRPRSMYSSWAVGRSSVKQARTRAPGSAQSCLDCWSVPVERMRCRPGLDRVPLSS
jgi:hypothetical protein